MEEQELEDEEGEAGFGLLFHAVDCFVHAQSTFSTTKSETWSKHTTERRNNNTEETKGHPTSSSRQVAKLGQM